MVRTPPGTIPCTDFIGTERVYEDGQFVPVPAGKGRVAPLENLSGPSHSRRIRWGGKLVLFSWKGKQNLGAHRYEGCLKSHHLDQAAFKTFGLQLLEFPSQPLRVEDHKP